VRRFKTNHDVPLIIIEIKLAAKMHKQHYDKKGNGEPFRNPKDALKFNAQHFNPLKFCSVDHKFSIIFAAFTQLDIEADMPMHRGK